MAPISLRPAAALSLFTIAALGLAGCAGGSTTDESTDTTGAADSNVSTSAPAGEMGGSDQGSDEAPALEGEGIAYGTESITGLDYDITCSDLAGDASGVGTATDADGGTHSIMLGADMFSYSAIGSDPLTDTLSISAGEGIPGTSLELTVDGETVTVTGVADVGTPANPSQQLPFTASFDCDSSI